MPNNESNRAPANEDEISSHIAPAPPAVAVAPAAPPVGEDAVTSPSPAETPSFQIKQDFTAEEAVNVLSDRSHIHPDARKYFGDTLVNELLEIVEDNDLFELDAMLLQGDLSIREMEEYLTLLPEYHQLNRRMFDWADKLIKHITRRLEATLQESVDKRGRLVNTRGLVRMQKSVFDMMESFENRGCATKRNALLYYLKNYLGQALIFDIWYRATADPRLQKYVPLLKIFVSEVDQSFLQGLGFNYPGIISLQAFGTFRSAYVTNQQTFEQFLAESDKELKDPNNSAEITEDINNDFQKIHTLSLFRNIHPFTRKYGDTTVEIYGSEYENDVKSSKVAYVKISFPGSDPGIRLRPGPVQPNGSYALNTHIEFKSFQFVIDRHSGNLLISASLIPLDTQFTQNRGKPFLKENEFLRLKALIYRMLREYLEDKPEDKEKVFFKSTAQPEALRESTRKQIKEAVAAAPATAEPAPVPITPTYVYTPFERPSRPQAQPEPQLPEQEDAPIIQDTRLDGAYSEEAVINTICRITGNPPLKSSRSKQRGKGSHVVVQGQNGTRFPLPCHAGKDLSPAILKRCLQKLQIPYSTFKTEY